MSIILLTGLLILSFIFLLADDEDKSEMKFKELPQKVQLAFGKIADVKQISEIESEKEAEDITAYEIEIKNGKTEISYIFTQDGALIETKKSIDYKELPEITKRLLKEKFPKLEIEELEEVTEISYELEGKIEGKEIEIEICNDGDIEVEKDGDENDDNDDDD